MQSQASRTEGHIADPLRSAGWIGRGGGGMPREYAFCGGRPRWTSLQIRSRSGDMRRHVGEI
jgi:hypothetical protein